MFSLRGLIFCGGLSWAVGLASSVSADVILPKDTSYAHYVAISFTTNDHLTLSGHLALPTNAKPPYPAVLLLVGSGTGNRYEDVPGAITSDGQPSLLFQPIETQLLVQGIAVMTYDKRGVQPIDDSFLNNIVNWGLFATISADNLAADALLAFDNLAGQPLIDAHHLAVLGHSEGTILALKVAEQRPEAVQGLFMLGLLTRSWHDLLIYQGVTTPMREFYTLDLNGDGYLTDSEYVTALAADPRVHDIFGDWSTFVASVDKSGDGRVSAQELNYSLETAARGFFASLGNATAPWPPHVEPRQWFVQYFAEGAYLERELKLCNKIHLFQGEIDIQTPFEDALELADSCIGRGTDLASFNSYPGDGHGFSTRVGYRGIRDTVGPMDPRVPPQIGAEAARLLRP